MTATSLCLVGFADKAQSDDVRRMVRSLGYEVDVLPPAHWLSDNSVALSNPVLLFLARKDLPIEAIVRVLKTAVQRPSLALFDYRKVERTRDILTYCDEFSGWPCHQHDLALRLKRLFPESTTPLDPAAARIAEEFLELDMVGKSPRFLHTLAYLKRLARCDAPVLIQGATGTGKEMAARAIHYLGARREYPFTPVNCGAIPDNLLENELFGHERGAFTDAGQAHCGLIAQAECGSLFLDEIDALSSKGQVSLLRFLQDQKYKPLGDRHMHKANVRILAATNVDLKKSVCHGEFRQDLWFRLHVLPLTLPALADRSDDIQLLAEHFLRRYGQQYGMTFHGFTQRALKRMRSYHWPGNVRELENLIHRSVLTADGPVIDIPHPGQDELFEDVATSVEVPAPTSSTFNDAKCRAVADFERRYLTNLMSEAHGNVTLAAKRAGKERRALGKLLKKNGIDPGWYT